MPLSKEQEDIIAKLKTDPDLPSCRCPACFGETHFVPLSIDERTLVRETLRAAWLTHKEWKAYKRQIELRQYEVAKEIARRGVPYGQREQFVQALYGRSRKALRQFIRRLRRRKQP
jgi:hypothetical protein